MRNIVLTLEQRLVLKIERHEDFIYPDGFIPETTPKRLYVGYCSNYFNIPIDVKEALDNDEVLVGRKLTDGKYELLSYKR